MKHRMTIKLQNGSRAQARQIRVIVRSAGQAEPLFPAGQPAGLRLELREFCSHQFTPEITVRESAPPGVRVIYACHPGKLRRLDLPQTRMGPGN
jgi:hypothetical protein